MRQLYMADMIDVRVQENERPGLSLALPLLTLLNGGGAPPPPRSYAAVYAQPDVFPQLTHL
jgi:hypothetical protein